MKTKSSLLAMLAVLLFSACDNTNSIVPPLDEQPITVTADVVQHTRAGYESGVLMPEKFIMDITQSGDDKFNYSLVEMTKDAESNTYSAPEGLELLWADDTHAATLKAMTVPMGLTDVDAEGVMAVSVSLEQNNASNVAASDLLGATSESNGGITVTDNNINVEFKHLLSKLYINYELGVEYDKNTVSINSITLLNTCIAGGYSYATMTYDSTNLTYGDIVMFLDASACTAEVIFYPYKPSHNPILLLNATINGVEYNFSCPVVPKDANGFIGGKRYTMNVSIVGSSVSGTEASIANGWNTNTDEETFVTE